MQLRILTTADLDFAREWCERDIKNILGYAKDGLTDINKLADVVKTLSTLMRLRPVDAAYDPNYDTDAKPARAKKAA